jgi:hypothetical protein
LNVNNRLCDLPLEFQVDMTDRPMTSMIELLGTETDIASLTDELLREIAIFQPET